MGWCADHGGDIAKGEAVAQVSCREITANIRGICFDDGSLNANRLADQPLMEWFVIGPSYHDYYLCYCGVGKLFWDVVCLWHHSTILVWQAPILT